MIYDSLESAISDVVLELQFITGCETTSYKLNVKKVHASKKHYKDPSSLTLIKMLGLNISLTEKLSKRQIIFVQTVI